MILFVLCSLAVVAVAEHPPGASITGAALNGMLQLEDWMFSWPEGEPVAVPYPFDEVSSRPDLPQGRRFPSEALPPDLIDPWASEGGLIGTTAARLGDAAVIGAITQHRETYYTEYDFAAMARAGIGHARLALGWWAFAADPDTVTAPALIGDPCHPEKRFVAPPGSFLRGLLAQAGRHNVSLLVDLHAMPCGSSDGTYNGVFPADPTFFGNASARARGLGVVRTMLRWYAALEPALRRAVHGFTLLNEPGLGLVPGGTPGPRPGVTPLAGGNASVVAWLGSAVEVFEELAVVGTAVAAGNDDAHQPLLYMNLHQAAFPPLPAALGGASSIEQMAGAMAGWGLSGKPWAVLDVHQYLAWSGDGRGVPAANCSSDETLGAYVGAAMQQFTGEMQAAAAAHGIARIACSEWSLSLHHKDHVAPCAAPNALDVMYRTQVAAFAAADMAQFFWGWRMPQGGCHEAKWSLKFHLTGMH